MELDGVLCGNSLLKEFFNEYLRLAMFPIQLSYDDTNGMITETNMLPWQQEPGIRIKLLDWAENFRWPYFLKSRLYHEYCLCILLFPQAKLTLSIQGQSSRQLLQRPLTTTSNGFIVRNRSSYLELVGVASDTGGVASGRASVSSLGLPDDIWDEEPVAMATEITHIHESYLEFQKFKMTLHGTTGETLMKVWLGIEEWKTCCHDNWLTMKILRKKMESVHLKEQIGSEEWRLECMQYECLDRLKTYWLQRFFAHTSIPKLNNLQSTSNNCTGDDKWTELESCDTHLPFIEGLRCNRHYGNPFQAYLKRMGLQETVNQVNFWNVCDQMLTQHLYCNEKEFMRDIWRMWSTFIHDENIGTSKKELFSALCDECAESVREKLEHLQLEILSQLKRLWTQYLHDDHDCYQLCFGKRNSSCHGDKQPVPVSSKSRRSNKRRKKRKRTISIDLSSGPLELLDDMDTLLSFEQYLYTECGPLSVENICYQLWKNIMKYHKITQLRRRDALAIQIHHTFLYQQSTRCIALPDELKEHVDSQQEINRPTTPTLIALEQLAANVIELTVKKFLFPEEDDGLESLPSIGKPYKTSLPRGSKVSRSSTVIFQEESIHLTHTLVNADGRTPHKLRAFASYLEEQAPPSVKGILVNNVQFWLEVKKFKTMYDDQTNMKVLFHKGEAIVDKYLDTTSPPWVKVSLNSEVATHIVSAVADLSRVKVRSNIDKLCDLLLKAQQITFSDMLPYWGPFCQQYKSPDSSLVSLPPVTSCLGRSSSRYIAPTLQLPALTKMRERTPLLSFSQYKGLQWKLPLQH